MKTHNINCNKTLSNLARDPFQSRLQYLQNNPAASPANLAKLLTAYAFLWEDSLAGQLFRFVTFPIAIFILLVVSTSQLQADESADLSAYLQTEQPRFQPFEPNYAIWQYTDDDNDAIEAHYSFKYLISRPDCETDALFQPSTSGSNEKRISIDRCVRDYWNRWEVFGKFTGEFDFYLGTRESGPVVNRISNPGLHVRRYVNQYSIKDIVNINYIDAAVQHLSNGQTTNAELQRDGQSRAQFFFDQDPFSPFFDTISREVDFLSLEVNGRLGRNAGSKHPISGRCTGISGCYDFWFRVIPFYVNDDNPVTWGTVGGRRPTRIADYDRFRLTLSRKRTYISDTSQKQYGIRESELYVTWRVGDELLKTDSFDVGLFLPISLPRGISLPLFLEYHRGPLNNLSNYSASQNSIGVGFRFN